MPARSGHSLVQEMVHVSPSQAAAPHPQDCGSILGGVFKNAPPRSGTLCYLNRVFDWPLEHMECTAVDFPYAFSNALSELRAGLIHSQQNTSNFQVWIETGLNGTYHVQHIRNTFTGQKMGLNRNDAVVGGCQGVNCKQFML